jgi:hypothetical protein
MTRKRTPGQEGGQTLILFALGMAAILGFTAMAIDVGLLYEDRRHLQNTADAAALAGAAELPGDPAEAQATAQEWALKHGLSADQLRTVEVRSTFAANDTLFVEVGQPFDWIFGRALGMTSSDVSAKAAARVGSLAGGHDFLPWAMVQGESDCLDGDGDPLFGTSCVVKLGASDGVSGWYGALDADGNGGGSAEYRDNIIDGEVEWLYCIEGDPSPGCAGAHTTIGALSGNKVGPTDSGIDQRLAQGARCDSNGNNVDDFDEVLMANPGGDPNYTVICPDSPWLIILPIVSYTDVPVKDVTIEGWTLAYLEGYYCSTGGLANCNGAGHWEVNVQIVDAAYSQTAGFLGAYNSDSGILLRRLVE